MEELLEILNEINSDIDYEKAEKEIMQATLLSTINLARSELRREEPGLMASLCHITISVLRQATRMTNRAM